MSDAGAVSLSTSAEISRMAEHFADREKFLLTDAEVAKASAAISVSF